MAINGSKGRQKKATEKKSDDKLHYELRYEGEKGSENHIRDIWVLALASGDGVVLNIMPFTLNLKKKACKNFHFNCFVLFRCAVA